MSDNGDIIFNAGDRWLRTKIKGKALFIHSKYIYLRVLCKEYARTIIVYRMLGYFQN
jgi:hypothetical protein